MAAADEYRSLAIQTASRLFRESEGYSCLWDAYVTALCRLYEASPEAYRAATAKAASE